MKIRLKLKHLRQEAAALLPGSAVRRARADYFNLAEQAADVYDQLDTAWYSTTRARILSELAVLHGGMAREYATGWHTTALDQELTDDYDNSAALLHVLAGTEAAESPEFRARATQDGWEEAFGQVLDDITTEPLAARRAELMTRLYLVAHPVIGGGAAETISRVGDSHLRVALRAAQSLTRETEYDTEAATLR